MGLREKRRCADPDFRFRCPDPDCTCPGRPLARAFPDSAPHPFMRRYNAHGSARTMQAITAHLRGR